MKTHVEDVKVIGISLIKRDDAPNSILFRGPPGNRKALLITLVSSSDIASEAVDIFLEASLRPCSQTGILAHSRIYYSGAALGLNTLPSERQQLQASIAVHPENESYLYQVWFDTEGTPSQLIYINPSPPHNVRETHFPPYDLTMPPEDLCIEISGNPYMGIGIGLVTNTIIVSKKAILDAIESGLRN